MEQLPGMLGTAFDSVLVVFGFGLIIFLHELGHFLAARWAGIRVLAFAIGFGPAAASYRKGMGFRRGSSEAEYIRLAREGKARGLSPTEYRLNWLPIGGYVKMLGQEDLDPSAVSSAPDSFQNRPIWKRMVVISAGVAANLVTAAVLFILVFMVGLSTPPAVVGAAAPGSPAATAVAVNADRLGVTEPGLQSGDRVLEVNGRHALEFTDLIIASSMSRRNVPVSLLVARDGVDKPLLFDIVPKESEATKLLELGIEPPRSATLGEFDPKSWAREAERAGLPGLESGSTLVSAGGSKVELANELPDVFEHSGGKPIKLAFEKNDATQVYEVAPDAELELAVVPVGLGRSAPIEHLLGLVPVMSVLDVEPGSGGAKGGLRPGDVFARIGAVEFPSIAEGVREVKAHTGGDVELEVLRREKNGWKRVALTARVNTKGMIGFLLGDTSRDSTRVALPPRERMGDNGQPEAWSPPAESVIHRPGSRVLSVAGTPVSNFRDIREALKAATQDALANKTGATVELRLELPLPSDKPLVDTVSWTLSPGDVSQLHALGWSCPIALGAFEPAETLLKAKHPADAVVMGIARTHRVMVMTYLTIARLFEGTVKVEHLKGPVGIAQIGTRIASRGPIWLLFFMALISVNLAVINFLPLPIVDGGQFLFLVYEQIRGRPAPIIVQNAITFAGLILIAAVFLVVTFHDVQNLLGG